MSGNAGKYNVTVTDSTNTRTVGDTAHNLKNVVITDTTNNETIAIDDVVSVHIREQWADTVFKHAKEGLDHPDGPSCCYVNARYVAS